MQYLKALIMVELTPYQALTYLATLSAYLKACSEAESLSSLIRLRRAKHTGDALQSSPKKRDSKRFFLYCCHRKEMQCNGILSTSVPSIFPIIHKKNRPRLEGRCKRGPFISKKESFHRQKGPLLEGDRSPVGNPL